MSIYKKELLSFYSEGDTFRVADFINKMRKKYNSSCPDEAAIRNGIHRLAADGWLTPDANNRGIYVLLSNTDPNIRHMYLHTDTEILNLLENTLGIVITKKMHFLLLNVRNKYIHKWIFICDAVDNDILSQANLGPGMLVRKPLIKFTSHNWFSVCFIELFRIFVEESPLFLNNISSPDIATYCHSLGALLDAFSDFASRTGKVRKSNTARVTRNDIRQYLIKMLNLPYIQKCLLAYEAEKELLDQRRFPLSCNLIDSKIRELHTLYDEKSKIYDTNLIWIDFGRFAETFFCYKAIDSTVSDSLALIGITASLMESASRVQNNKSDSDDSFSKPHFFIFRR